MLLSEMFATTPVQRISIVRWPARLKAVKSDILMLPDKYSHFFNWSNLHDVKRVHCGDEPTGNHHPALASSPVSQGSPLANCFNFIVLVHCSHPSHFHTHTTSPAVNVLLTTLQRSWWI